jgi:F0F1-type ATP synthase alpha subunit
VGFCPYWGRGDEATQRQIQRGLRLQAALTQPAKPAAPLALQIALLLAVTEGHLDDVREELRKLEHDLLSG